MTFLKNFSRTLPLVTALLCLLIAPSTLLADAEDAAIYQKKGHELLKEKKLEHALAQFKLALEEDPYDRNLNFLIGLISFQLGNNEEALFAYERALAIDPKNVPALLEKVRVLIAMGALSQAREELQKAKRMNLSPELRRNVEAYYIQLSSKKEHEFSGLARVAHMWDSNATLGTETETSIELSDVTTLNADPTSRSDWNENLLLAGNHSYSLTERGTWKSNVTFFGSRHNRLITNEIDLLSLSTGFAYNVDNKHLFDFSIGGSKTNLKRQLFQTAEFVNFTYTYTHSPRHVLRASHVWTGRNHFSLPGSAGVDEVFGFVSKVTTGYTFVSEDGNYIWDLGFSYAFDKTPRPANDANVYRSFVPSVKLTRMVIPELINVYISYNRTVKDYREKSFILASTDETRFDRANALTFGSNIKISEELGLKRDWFVDIIATISYNKSNEEQSTYRAQQLTLQLSTPF
jgi:tetratricopeptide (TPR) repeat protein